MRALKQTEQVRQQRREKAAFQREEISEGAKSEQRITWGPSEISICLLEGKNQSWPLMRIRVIISLSGLDHLFINKINLDESLRFEK